VFSEGIFKVGQTKRPRPMLTLTLQGKVGPCPSVRRKRARTAAAAKRKLWGDGKGRMRTVGKRSAAIVRGTRWLVEDSCAGTLTRVRSGVVTVEVFATGKTKRLTRGQQFLAPSQARRRS
jgi:hypothetical protein